MRLSVLFVLLSAAVSLADWRQFRGPGGNGVADGTPPPGELTKENILWSADLPGRGLSSPIIIGGKVVVTASSGPAQERLHVFCFSAETGKKLWERQFQATGRTMCHEKTCVAAPTPCSDGLSVFASFSTNDVVCLGLDGTLKWLRGLTHDYPNASNSLGMASSLLVAEGTLVTIVENDSDSFAVGLDSMTGVNKWKIARKKIANWCSPVSFASGGKTTVVLMSSDGVVGIDPANGSQRWKIDGGSTMPSCAVGANVLLVPWKGTTAWDLSKPDKEPEELWQSGQLNNATSSPVIAGGNVFVVTSAGVLTRGSLADGQVAWKLRLNGRFSGSPVMAGAFLYAVSEEGNLKVADTAAEPEGKLLTDLKLDGGTLLCTPAISDSAVYVRSDRKLWKLGRK